MIFSRNRSTSLVESSTGMEVQLEEFSLQESHFDAISAIMQIHENDMKMFDAIIECDFIEVDVKNNCSLDEATRILTEAEEEKKGNIFTKIASVAKFVIKKIGEAIKTILAKLNQLIYSDKKILAKYNKTVDHLDLTKFEGFKNAVDFGKYFGLLKSETIISKISEMDSEAANVKTEEQYNTFSEKIDKAKEDLNKVIEEAAKTVESYKPTSEDVDDMSNAISNSSLYKKGADALLKFTKETMDKLVKNAKEEAGKKEGDEATALNFIYKATSAIGKYNIYLATAIKNVNFKAYGLARKYFIQLARFSSKAAKDYEKNNKGTETKSEEKKEEEAQKEAVLMSLLAEDSDFYVESVVYGY